MDINEDTTKEKAMSGKLKMTDKMEGGSETESDSTENSKSKKRCESSMGKVNPKNVKITVPSSGSHGNHAGNQTGEPACVFSRSSYPV